MSRWLRETDKNTKPQLFDDLSLSGQSPDPFDFTAESMERNRRISVDCLDAGRN